MSSAHEKKPPRIQPTQYAEIAPLDGETPDESSADLKGQASWPHGSLFHWSLLVASLFVLTAACLLKVRADRRVVVPVIEQPLPGTCTFRSVTGKNCPGCGMTRSFISLAHGQWAAAWYFNPAGYLFFVLVVFQVPYQMIQIRRVRRGLQPYRFLQTEKWLVLLLAIVLMLQWCIRLAYPPV